MKNLFVIIAITLFIICLFKVVIILNPKGEDFKMYYYASNSLKLKQNIYKKYLTSPKKDKITTVEYNYPPFFAFIFTPFTLLPFNIAKNIWYFFNLICFYLCLFLIFFIIKIKPKLGELCLIFIVSLISSPVLTTLYYGQVNFILVFLVLFMLYFYQNNKIFFSALMLSLSILIKVFPLFFLIYFIAKKDFKFIIFLGITFFLLLVVSMGVSFGYFVNLYKIYLLEVIPILSYPSATLANQSLGGFIARLFIPNPYLKSIFLNYNLGIFLYKFLSTVIIIFVFLFLSKKVINQDLPYAFSFLIIIFLITSPLVWMHYYVFLIFPFIYIFYKVKKNLLDKVILTIAVLSTFFIYDHSAGSNWEGIKILFLSLSFYGLLLMAYLLIKDKITLLKIDNLNNK